MYDPNFDSCPFDLSGIASDVQKGWIQEAIRRTRFRFKTLIPGLVAQVRRETIPVLFSDLSRYNATEDGGNAHQHEHPHDHETGDEAHPIHRTNADGRRQTLGLAWYSGKVEIEKSCDHDLALEVFLAEGAHMVDFFYMTPEQREKIFDLYHAGGAVHAGVAHDHGWFEETGNQDYFAWVGESFMYGFTAAFSDVPYSGDSFAHRTTPEIALQIAEILQPSHQIVRSPKSSIVHRLHSWHEKQIRDSTQISYPTIAESEAAGMRRCKTCRWNEVV